jgi:aminoglycoside phosphotransferase (APT) family kinase protein
MRPSNMRADPARPCITAVLDWEFTNATPAQLAADVPSWLLLEPPSA